MSDLPKTNYPASMACTQCNRVLLLEKFSVSKSGKHGRHTWCKECKCASARRWYGQHRDYKRAQDKKWYASHGEHARALAKEWHQKNHARSLANKKRWKLGLHGLTEQDKLAMHVAQRGRCAICDKALTIDQSKVDHDHSSDQVRGLLCHHCNIGLGHFFDSPTLLSAAAKYIAERMAKSA